jgi:lipoprotein-anchoring transpeptidase ErfK/SrfK
MKTITLLGAALSAIIAASAPAHAFQIKSQKTGGVELAALEGANTGWLQVLGADQPRSRKQARADINVAPIGRKLVAFDSAFAPGSIVIDNSDRRLYHVISKGLAVSYGVSVGRDGFRWTGAEVVTAKAEWPDWNPPAEMRVREAKKGHILPETMPGGANNPLGARALYLGDSEFRIHGTNQPLSIGHAMSSGCIRMANEDVEHLYASVTIGAKVIVRD